MKVKFKLGDLVTKISGSSWTGKVVGTYSTTLTPIGYCVESINEPGSVQIYPEKALRSIYVSEFYEKEIETQFKIAVKNTLIEKESL